MVSTSRTVTSLVGRALSHSLRHRYLALDYIANGLFTFAVLYHQPEKMAKSKEDLAERQENLEKLKKQHGID